MQGVILLGDFHPYQMYVFLLCCHIFSFHITFQIVQDVVAIVDSVLIWPAEEVEQSGSL